MKEFTSSSSKGKKSKKHITKHQSSDVVNIVEGAIASRPMLGLVTNLKTLQKATPKRTKSLSDESEDSDVSLNIVGMKRSNKITLDKLQGNFNEER